MMCLVDTFVSYMFILYSELFWNCFLMILDHLSYIVWIYV